MRVRCTRNRYGDLPPTSSAYVVDGDDAEMPLRIGMEYVVYGVYGTGSELLYSVLISEHSRVPDWFPAMLFDITDGGIPSCWQFVAIADEGTNVSKFIMTFPEWATDRSFNWNLIENVPQHQLVWRRYRTLIDEESKH